MRLKTSLHLLVPVALAVLFSLSASAFAATEQIEWSSAQANGWKNPLGEGASLITHTNYDFDSEIYLNNWGKRHSGVDIHAKPTTPIYAIAPGNVVKVVRSSDSYEAVVIIRHETGEMQGFFAIYGHVFADPSVQEGKPAPINEPIGCIVEAGTPSHLHFGINTKHELNEFYKPELGLGWGLTPAGTDPRSVGWVDPVPYLSSVTHSISQPAAVDIQSPTTAPNLNITELVPSSITTNTAPFDAELRLQGAGFTKVVQVSWSWMDAVCGSKTWYKGDSNWNEKVTANSDTSMTLRPRVVETNPTWSGTVYWALTLRDDTGAEASRWFAVTYRESAAETKAVDALIEALKNEDDSVRMDAVRDWAYQDISDPRAVDALIGALKDEDEDVRNYAAYALGDISDQRAIDALVGALKDQSEYVRQAAASALGDIGSKTRWEGMTFLNSTKAIDPLIEALKDDCEWVRQSAAVALGQIGDARGMDPLITALKDESSYVRQAAAYALGSINDPRAVDALIEALKDEDEDVRSAAAMALGWFEDDERVADPLVEALQDEKSCVRVNVAYALVELGKNEYFDLLIVALKNEDVKGRSEAAMALGNIRDPRAVDSLIEALETDPDYYVKCEAAWALGWIGDPRAIDALTYVAYNDEDEGIRGAALQALEKMQNQLAP